MNAKSYASTSARDKGLRVTDGTFPIRAIGGQKRFAARVCFCWSVVGATDLELVITEQQSKDARLRGVSLPQISGLAAVAACSAWCARALEGLEKAANDFVNRYGPELRLEFGVDVKCTYATLFSMSTPQSVETILAHARLVYSRWCLGCHFQYRF